MNFQNASFEFAVGTSAGLPPCTLPEVVFSGRSNVGKSSLINRLVNRKSLARTSSTPGKTATINFYRLGFCRFADLPGYGYAKVSKAERERWSELVEGYFNQERRVGLVVQILDMRRLPAADDVNMLDYLAARGFPFVVAASKCDKLNATARAEQEERLGAVCRARGADCLPFSAVSGEGVERLRRVILSACR